MITLIQELRRDVIGICENPARPIVGEVLTKFDNVEWLLNMGTETVDNEPQFNTWFFDNLGKGCDH